MNQCAITPTVQMIYNIILILQYDYNIATCLKLQEVKVGATMAQVSLQNDMVYSN